MTRRPRKKRPTERDVYVLVKVRASTALTAAQVRREVRTLVNSQCFYEADETELKAVFVRPAKAP